MDQAAFLTDPRTCDAVAMNLLAIGENVVELDPLAAAVGRIIASDA